LNNWRNRTRPDSIPAPFRVLSASVLLLPNVSSCKFPITQSPCSQPWQTRLPSVGQVRWVLSGC